MRNPAPAPNDTTRSVDRLNSGVEVPRAIAQIFAQARRPMVLTGAGISADSGVPTFRDAATGLWARHDPAALATPDGWCRDPALVWGWYCWRRRLVRSARPNPGHDALARWAAQSPGLTLVTQNVDDLHERAGSPEVTHLHGSLFASRCTQCGTPYDGPDACGAGAPASSADVVAEPSTAGGAEASTAGGPEPSSAGDAAASTADGAAPSTADDAAGIRIQPPRCGVCGGLVRPGVVWFDEPIPTGPWHRAVAAVQDADALFVIGTSGLVSPAADLPRFAMQRRIPVVEINPGPSELGPRMSARWAEKAARALPALVPAALATA